MTRSVPVVSRWLELSMLRISIIKSFVQTFTKVWPPAGTALPHVVEPPEAAWYYRL